ncbi:acetyl xylan esterase [Streptococcus pneumoniae]|uniref:Acetyl xylan esterase n=1 Tax=Streptococcus pneumoniae TaxID=1313 RepID=A0A4M3K1D0_STREE|nr:acetyl xylan esterase [Streptococcus pneumoniae]VNM40294.1 acetyl xylan esterase [Streptococcus pneumoniae]VOC99939.1 acetyl xylan esterase [Streptococcus pneumoniae]VOM16995.1 acetyl xylan esterase [Streptococcus pneumoniae]VPU87680.1 acetyl xylan esterase [Streptococcus pneumoniae]
MKNPALLEEMKIYLGRDEVPEDVDAFWDEEVKKVSHASSLPVGGNKFPHFSSQVL